MGKEQKRDDADLTAEKFWAYDKILEFIYGASYRNGVERLYKERLIDIFGSVHVEDRHLIKFNQKCSWRGTGVVFKCNTFVYRFDGIVVNGTVQSINIYGDTEYSYSLVKENGEFSSSFSEEYYFTCVELMETKESL